jgi:methionine-rich copper-binding protein CopC
MRAPIRSRRVLRNLLAAALLTLLMPPTVAAHADLVSSDPAGGATVPSPFGGPIVMTFSEHLADGSKADLVGPDGSTVATATVDATAATMTISVSSVLAPGNYQARWTTIADDGHLLRGILRLTVAPAASEPPSASPSPSSAATNPPSAAATVASAGASPAPATAAASPAAATDAGGAGTEVILPIIIVLIVVAAGAFYLVRRNRPAR